MVVIGKIARISFSGSFINARAGTLLPRGARKCLPADKIKIQVFVNGREIIGVAGDEVSTDSPRCQRNQYIKVNLPGFLDSVSFRLPKSIHDPSRLNPFPLIRRDDVQIFRQTIDKSSHQRRARATRQFGQHHRAATNDELEIENLLFKAS